MARSLSGWVIRSTGWPGDQEKKRVLCKKREEGNEDFTGQSVNRKILGIIDYWENKWTILISNAKKLSPSNLLQLT